MLQAGLPFCFRRFSRRLFASVLLVVGLGSALLVQAREPSDGRALVTIALAQLPPQARQTHALIQAGGPFPYSKDGSAFGNRERLLPAQPRGYYLEYTVQTPGTRDRGARRVVCGGAPRAPDVCYYSNNHYASFSRIVD
jgi:ribonuclease T1